MTKHRSKKDPHYKREASRYAEPIVSREAICTYVAKHNEALSMTSLITAFSLHSAKEQEALRRRLGAMCRDGQLRCNAQGDYQLMDEAALIEGIVEVGRDGRGYVVVDNTNERVGLSASQLKQVFPGDRVRINTLGVNDNNQTQGAINRVLHRAHPELIGRFHREEGISFVVPEDNRIRHDIIILPGHDAAAKNTQFVTVKITHWPSARTQAIGEVIAVLGDSMSSTLAIDVAKKTFELPDKWPEGMDAVLKRLSHDPSTVMEADREDLTALDFLTIDGADAKDFDDAVYATSTDNGFHLRVAIADVSHYVQPNSLLDAEALKRGTSVYFPDQVLPMLPETLSNDLCSLRPNVPRLALVCDMHINTRGELNSFRFYKGLIQSKARLTYHEVADYLTHGEFTDKTVPDGVKTAIKHLHALYKCLLMAREQRGALNFNTQDSQIVLDASGQVEKIIATSRNDAHKLIEECMLVANVAAAEFTLQQQCPALFRVHGAPEQDRIADLSEFLGFRGVSLKGGLTPTVKQLNDVLLAFEDHEDQPIVENVILRSMAQAVYRPDHDGHYGLGYEAYAHFTSPIRRYPDLITHRIIKALLSSEDKAGKRYARDTLQALGTDTSFTERRAESASRDVEKSLKCAYMANKVGQTFDGIISGVTNFGFFVTITALRVDGLVHCKNLRDDYYLFDEKRQMLVGQRANRRFQFGDDVRVQVAHVDLNDRKIDFELDGQQTQTPKKKATYRKGGGPSSSDKPAKKTHGAKHKKNKRGKQSKAEAERGKKAGHHQAPHNKNNTHKKKHKK